MSGQQAEESVARLCECDIDKGEGVENPVSFADVTCEWSLRPRRRLGTLRGRPLRRLPLPALPSGAAAATIAADGEDEGGAAHHVLPAVLRLRAVLGAVLP